MVVAVFSLFLSFAFGDVEGLSSILYCVDSKKKHADTHVFLGCSNKCLGSFIFRSKDIISMSSTHTLSATELAEQHAEDTYERYEKYFHAGR